MHIFTVHDTVRMRCIIILNVYSIVNIDVFAADNTGS